MLETETHSGRRKWIIVAAVTAAALVLAFGGWLLWSVTRPVPGGSIPGSPDNELVAALASDYPAYGVIGYEFTRGRGANATQGPGSEFAWEAWRFALQSPDLPGRPLVVSYVRYVEGEDSSQQWRRLDEFFTGPSISDQQVGLAAAFAADHPGESCLGAYEIEASRQDARAFRVGYHRQSGTLTIESEYTYELASGQWAWDQDATHPDLRWGTLRPELAQ